MTTLERGEKVVKQVSQESIIANLVEEVENCGEGKDFRDVFVTAPTGAGKSVMFQVPAIYLAKKYNLLTIVISPLIGLMNDQVKNLELKNYPFAKTINSDISPIIKQDIIEKVSDGQYHIQKYQLIKVIEKVDELYYQSMKAGNRRDFTKKRNAMLLDAENFTYIFGSPVSDEDSNVNKVKTALLLIQKDFESKIGLRQ